MRLICPNCGAQYEVPPEAIPPAGRDVQCSACSHTWFVHPSAPEPLSEPEPWDLVRRVTDDEEEADDLAEVEAAPLASAPPAPRSTVTPEVAGILRAEAEREAQVRAQQDSSNRVAVTDRPAPPTFQPLPGPSATPVMPERPTTPERSATPERLTEPARPARAPERRLDLDQINSSLRMTNDRIGGRAPQIGPTRRSGGFARGFWGALLILAVLAGLYVTAPTLMEALPQSRVVLEPYVAVVDGVRLWLDRQVGAVLGSGASTE